MATEDQILSLAALAEENQAAVKALIDKAEKQKVDVVEAIRKGAGDALKGAAAPAAEALTRAANQASEAAVKVDRASDAIAWRCLIEAAVIIVFGLIVVVGVGKYANSKWSQIKELEYQIAQARETKEKLGTWGLELGENQEMRWIILPKGVTFSHQGKTNDGREALVLSGGR